ncbi:MAG: hypothetical protein HZA52_10730 [Planctomycetes bacterium]|nr:hypothetical protein [Planctomycetota bacterium]
MNRNQLLETLRAILADTGADEPESARHFSLRLARRPAAHGGPRGAGEPGGARGAGEPARARGLAQPGLAELERVHAREVAYLLREAARLRSTLDPRGRSWRWLAGKAGSLAAWRRALHAELELLALDRCRPSCDLARMLELCRGEDVADWPSALELADASLALASDEAGRLERVVALLAGGDFRAAARQAAGELDPWLAPRREGEFLAALAAAREGQARFDEALRFYELALERVERTTGAVAIAAHLLYLALALGERAAALRAADALVHHASRGDFDAREFERCTGELRAATARLRDERSFGVHPTMERQYLRFTAASPAVVRRVAVALS